MDICSVCDSEVVVSDGVYPVHYRSSLYRCEGSGQPAAAPDAQTASEPEVKKAAPRKKAPPKKP